MQSAPRTNDNSPPIHRWDQNGNTNRQSVKRTVDAERGSERIDW